MGIAVDDESRKLIVRAASFSAQHIVEVAAGQTLSIFKTAATLTMRELIKESDQCQSLDEFVTRIKTAYDKMITPVTKPSNDTETTP